jgi:hypothetical protein
MTSDNYRFAVSFSSTLLISRNPETIRAAKGPFGQALG